MTTGPKGDGLAADKEARDWYVANRERFTSFTPLLHATIENLIRAAHIDYFSVTSRTKSVQSFVEKMSRKGYASVDEATDLAGIRVIAFIESDADLIAKLLRRSFSSHPEMSLDKSEELGDSQVGYRSIHIICELAADRAKLPEYKPYKGLLFEVQVRTVLQHAWAAIDHERRYKFSGVLPAELRRRLNLLAGQLELADKEFSRLAGDVDVYKKEVGRKTRAGDLDIELSSDSIHEYLSNLGETSGIEMLGSEPQSFEEAIHEMQRFGINTLEDLQELMTQEYLAAVKATGDRQTEIGFVRRAMVYSDIDKYFANAYRGKWTGMSVGMRTMIIDKWGIAKLAQVEKSYIRPIKKQK